MRKSLKDNISKGETSYREYQNQYKSNLVKGKTSRGKINKTYKSVKQVKPEKKNWVNMLHLVYWLYLCFQIDFFHPLMFYIPHICMGQFV